MSNTALLLVTLEHFLFLQRSIPQIPFVQHSKESVWIEELIWILQISSECMVSSVHLQEITPGSSLPCLAQLLLTNWDSPRKCVICVAIWVDLSKTKGGPFAQRGPWMHSPFRKNACAFRTSCASSPCFYPCWGPAQLSSHLWDSSPDSGYFL